MRQPICLTGLIAAGLALPALTDTQPPHHPTILPAAAPALIDRAGVYPRAARLADGSLVAAYAAPSQADQVLRLARSTDNATTWAPLGEVARGAARTHDLDNAHVVQLPSGRLLYAFRNHDRAGDFPGGAWRYTWYRLTVCASDDGGRSWRFASQVEERGAMGVNGLWEPFLRVTKDGSVQVFYSAESDGAEQDNLMRSSRDGGMTWSAPLVVSGSGLVSRDGMTGVAEVNGNGTLICVFENTKNNTPFSVDYVLSRDDGLTWGERGHIYTAAGAGKEAGAPQVVNVGGVLVASFMTNENAATSRLDGGQMKVVTSTDGGVSWSTDAAVTGDVGSHWPGLFSLNSTHFLALYSKDGLGVVSQIYELVLYN